MSTSINDINSTEAVELQIATQSILDNILDRVFDSNSSISNQVEKSHCTSDDSKVGSLNDPERDEHGLKGTADQCSRTFRAKILNMSTSINDIKSTEEVELQMMIQNEPNSDSNSKISDQLEKNHSTGDITKVGSLKYPEEDEPLMKGKDF